jgi:hypothetical protein
MKKILLSSLVSVVITSTLMANDSDSVYDGTSVGGQISLFGAGLNVKGKFGDSFGVRAGFDKYTQKDIDVNVDDAGDAEVKYIFDADMQDFLLVGDYHPWQGSFRMSGGMIINGTKFDGNIIPNSKNNQDISFEFNDKTYTYKADELGIIHTKVDWDPVAPYVGLGWDTSFDKKSGWGFTCDLGVAFQGSATASYDLEYGKALDIDARIAQETKDLPDGSEKEAKITEIKQEVNSRKSEIDGEIKKELDKEMKDLQDDLDDLKILPYVSIGVNYKF